jgi:anthranilate phosphoribosyltransferase
MRHVGPIRQQLGLRTLFNLIGPLLNPAGARRQLMGVYAARLVPLVAKTLLELGADRALVVHGHGGLDEISPSGPTLVAQVEGGTIRTYEVTPEELGVPRGDLAGLRGGDAAENAAALRAVLAGERGVRRDAVLLNAAGAIVAAGVCDALEEGVRRAVEAIDSGKATGRLAALVAASRAEKLRAAGGAP